MPTPKNYPWTRYWIPAGENPAIQDGYFVEPSPDDQLRLGPKSNGKPLACLGDIPCLILLGDVGMGKTTETTKEADRLRAQLADQNHEVVRHDLKRMSETQILRRVFDDPKVRGWSACEHSLTLFLDSLDECWRRIDELESILVGELKRMLEDERPPLYLRLTCRSAEWRGNVGQALQRLFSSNTQEKDPLQIYSLAPLSQTNVIDAAAAEGRDADKFVNAIREREAQPLASHPMTLDMLLHIDGENGKLPSSRVELYEKGCSRLCADPHTEPTSTRQPATTLPQRLAIAARLAALCVLSNRYLINGDVERPSDRTDILDIQPTLGFYRETADGEHTTVDRDSMRETLRTALFGEKSEGAQAWRHQSHAEFLAARYLAGRDLSNEQIITLITDTSDNAGRLVPQLEQTACWLVDLRPDLFDLLAQSNAEVLIRCDPGNLDDSKRKTLIERYLELTRRHEAPDVDWQLKQKLANYNHPGLEDLLSGVVRDRSEHPLVRESAIEIARHCKCAAIAGDLIDAMLNPSEIYRIRKQAAHALAEMADDDIRDQLSEKASPEGLADSHDEVKGYFLGIMWPAQLSTTGLIDLLQPPRKRNYTGS